jgi:steroid delta-isomerase-like uncharacterized protein
MTTEQIIRAYYHAFNAAAWQDFFALLDDAVEHDINQGEREVGKPAFRRFMSRMNACYRETITDLRVMVDESGGHAAAEFVVAGEYLASDAELPPARGQRYQLAGGAFFQLAGGRIRRVTNYYNLREWLRQITT